MKRLGQLVRGFVSLIGTMFVLGLSLLPLSALLVALPLVSPNEAVLADTVARSESFMRSFFRRLFGLFASLMVLISLLAFSIECVSRLPLPAEGQLGRLSQKMLGFSVVDFMADPDIAPAEGKTPPSPRGLLDKRNSLLKKLGGGSADSIRTAEATRDLKEVDANIAKMKPDSVKLQIMTDPNLAPWLAEPLWKLLPTALVQHWPFVFLILYATDLLLLIAIGKVPIAYNARNLIVRWRIAGLTAIAFTVVVGLLVCLLAFVNGMYKLNATTGIPGNVFVLSDGATDELFSNLGYGDVDNFFRTTVELDPDGVPLPKPVRVMQGYYTGDGRLQELAPGEAAPAGQNAVYLASKEIYFVVNQAVEPKPGEAPRRRFLQMRAIQDPLIAGAVHNVSLQPGGQWFSPAGVQQGADGKSYIQAVLGEGTAGILGEDLGKPRLEIGDTFRAGDLDWIAVGIMKAEGTTFGSELWVQNIDLITRTFGKKGNFTTVVLRTDRDNIDAARAMGYHLQNRYTQQKLKAFAEPEYYAELTKTNDQFLIAIVSVAVIMAIGGVFGVMNTMFASITARIKEVGVLRILGFKRWQILISFMLESLAIAFIGGLLGCMIGYLANGFEARSNLGGGGGGGSKSVSLKMIVDYQTIAAGMLFTLVMGRLGGLVPALSAMRMKILDSLK